MDADKDTDTDTKPYASSGYAPPSEMIVFAEVVRQTHVRVRFYTYLRDCEYAYALALCVFTLDWIFVVVFCRWDVIEFDSSMLH